MFINNSSNGRLNRPSNQVPMAKRDHLLQEIFLQPEATPKIQLSNNSFSPPVQQFLLRELPPHNLCLISKGQNKLVVEVKRDSNFINRDNTILNNIEYSNRGNINKLQMQSYLKMVREELLVLNHHQTH